IGLGLHQQDLGPLDLAVGDDRLELGPRRAEPPAAGDLVHGHEADVVAVLFVFGARIAQPGDDDHAVLMPRASGSEKPRRANRAGPYLQRREADQASSASPSAVVSPASDWPAAEFLIAAIMKSRSAMIGVAPSGSWMSEMRMFSPISRPFKSTISSAGMRSARTRISTV